MGYNQIKKKKDLRWVTFKIENYKQIVVDSEGPATDTFQDFVKALPEGESRYALADIDYESEDPSSMRFQSKVCFFMWSPPGGGVKDKMAYSSAKDTIKNSFMGISKEIHASNMADLEEDKIMEQVKK